MAREIINVGSLANDGTGDPIRTCFIKSNNNFQELYNRYVAVTPSSSKGASGDVAGMYAISGQYFYFCNGSYDGTTDIWHRVSGSTF